jgi:hypothetical protein
MFNSPLPLSYLPRRGRRLRKEASFYAGCSDSSNPLCRPRCFLNTLLTGGGAGFRSYYAKSRQRFHGILTLDGKRVLFNKPLVRTDRGGAVALPFQHPGGGKLCPDALGSVRGRRLPIVVLGLFEVAHPLVSYAQIHQRDGLECGISRVLQEGNERVACFRRIVLGQV